MKRIIYTLLTAVVIIAAGCKGKEIQVDRSVVPAAGPAPKIQIGQYQLFELENGLKVIVVENHKLPRVSYSINLDTDPILEGDKAGYVSMAGDLMSAGTTTNTAKNFLA
jgi:predicted Zn-dependent peptidase